MEKRKTFLINFAYFALLLLLIFAALKYVLPAIAPFAIAFVIAWVLQRPIRLLKKLHLPAKPMAVLVVLLFYGVVGALLALIGIKAAGGIVTFSNNLPHLYEAHLLPFFTEVLQNIEAALMNLDPSLVAELDTLGTQMIQSLGQLIRTLSVTAVGLVTSTAAAIPGLFVKLVLMIISTFFIAIDYDRLTGFCLRQLSAHSREVFFQIKEYVAGTLWVCIRSYFIIMLLTFAELSLGLFIAKLQHAVLIAALIAIFDILPVLGTGGIMIPWMVLTALQGNFSLSLTLLAIYVIITVIRNIVEPKIVGSQLGLHPVVTLCSMFVGAQVFGLFGLFGLPILLSLLLYLDRHGVIRLPLRFGTTSQ